MSRRFEYSDNKTNKFWVVKVIGKVLTVRSGKIGTEGKSLTKKFKSNDAASNAADKQIKEKLKKGYRESARMTLITLGKGAKAVGKSVYKRNKKDFFYIEKTFITGKIVTKSPPKMNNKTETLLVSDYRFPVIPDSTSKLVLSKTLSAKDKKEIRKAFQEYCRMWKGITQPPELHIPDFELESDCIEIYTPCKIKEVLEATLKLFCTRVEYCLLNLSKADFTQYSSSGMPYTQFDYLDSTDSSTVASGAFFDEQTRLSVNDDEIPKSYKLLKGLISQGKKKTPPPKASARPKECAYAAVSEKMMNNAWWALTIYGPLDPSKLEAVVHYNFVKGISKPIETVCLFYDGQALRFLEELESNYDDMYLVDQQGKRHSFEVLEE